MSISYGADRACIYRPPWFQKRRAGDVGTGELIRRPGASGRTDDVERVEVRGLCAQELPETPANRLPVQWLATSLITEPLPPVEDRHRAIEPSRLVLGLRGY